jgi:hypothetical protein
VCNIIITGKAALFELSLPQKVLPDLSIQLHHLVFTTLEFTTICTQSMVVNLASNPNLTDRISMFMSPSDRVVQYNPRNQIPFWSPSTTPMAAVEVFKPASTHGRMYTHAASFCCSQP